MTVVVGQKGASEKPAVLAVSADAVNTAEVLGGGWCWHVVQFRPHALKENRGE